MLNDYDFETLKNDVKAIEGYLRTLMPNIWRGIAIRFGDTGERENVLFIKPNEIWGSSRFSDYTFDCSDSSNRIYVYDRIFGEDYMMSLVNCWPYIKQQINSELATQKRELDAIHSFVL